MTSSAWEWLETREPDVPESLRDRMRNAVQDVDDAAAETPKRLALAAIACLRAALAAGDDRAAALDLLAADALLTHASEAAVEAGSIEQFAHMFDADALDRLTAPGSG